MRSLNTLLYLPCPHQMGKLQSRICCQGLPPSHLIRDRRGRDVYQVGGTGLWVAGPDAWSPDLSEKETPSNVFVKRQLYYGIVQLYFGHDVTTIYFNAYFIHLEAYSYSWAFWHKLLAQVRLWKSSSNRCPRAMAPSCTPSGNIIVFIRCIGISQ